jgi:hypothetical protein
LNFGEAISDKEHGGAGLGVRRYAIYLTVDVMKIELKFTSCLSIFREVNAVATLIY